MTWLRAADVELAAYGALIGVVIGLTWTTARPHISSVTVVIAFALSAVAGLVDDPRVERARPSIWLGATAAAAILVALPRFARVEPDRRAWIGAAVLVSAIAAWGGVPETSGILVVGSTIAGLEAAAVVRRRPVTITAHVLMALAVGGVTIASAHPGGLREVGAAACLGLILWWPLGQVIRIAVPGSRRVGTVAGGWLLGGHAVVAVAAARWIAVDPGATWTRVGVLALAGTALSSLHRSPTRMER